jgi:hypothetical protein
MKKTYKQITDNLQQVTVEDFSGDQLVFLNGVLQQMSNKDKFLAARGPLNGSLMLIIADYAHWTLNKKDIEEWIKLFGTSIRQEGMILTFDHDADRTAFLLKWG